MCDDDTINIVLYRGEDSLYVCPLIDFFTNPSVIGIKKYIADTVVWIERSNGENADTLPLVTLIVNEIADTFSIDRDKFRDTNGTRVHVDEERPTFDLVSLLTKLEF